MYKTVRNVAKWGGLHYRLRKIHKTTFHTEIAREIEITILTCTVSLPQWVWQCVFVCLCFFAFFFFLGFFSVVVVVEFFSISPRSTELRSSTEGKRRLSGSHSHLLSCNAFSPWHQHEVQVLDPGSSSGSDHHYFVWDICGIQSGWWLWKFIPM